MDRRASILDNACEWLATHPWGTCLLILACIFIASCADRPDTMSRDEAVAISAIVGGE